jgi:hypothetical protein
MNNYPDYDYYKTSFLGELSETEFKKNVITAAAYVRTFTFGRSDSSEYEDEVKRAICIACDLLSSHNGREIVSENTDGYSVTYVTESTSGTTTESVLSAKIYSAIKVFLSGTGLLDWGIGE